MFLLAENQKNIFWWEYFNYMPQQDMLDRKIYHQSFDFYFWGRAWRMDDRAELQAVIGARVCLTVTRRSAPEKMKITLKHVHFWSKAFPKSFPNRCMSRLPLMSSSKKVYSVVIIICIFLDLNSFLTVDRLLWILIKSKCFVMCKEFGLKLLLFTNRTAANLPPHYH